VCTLALDQAGLDWRPDVMHCNDWQTGLVPALLAMETHRPATIFTIHNLAYQGLFDWKTFEDLELPYELWSMHALEFYGEMSFIKGGLSFADRINTVSPTYAQEIRTPEFGCGLEGLLNQRVAHLSGILNGVEYDDWNPETDRLIPAQFSSTDPAGKADDKRALQARFGLEERVELPMLGMVGRLVEQKGIDLLLAILDRLMELPLQVVILGSGQHAFEQALSGAAKNYPNLGVEIGYDEALAHLIEAGADLFLMPSRFEPCGLNQMYSLRYGTLPVVRRTGGLADTVVDADADALADGSASGFVFDEATPADLLDAIERALELHADAHAWRRVMSTAMRQDFSWQRSADAYLALYRDALAGI
jgi:starch synthase